MAEDGEDAELSTPYAAIDDTEFLDSVRDFSSDDPTASYYVSSALNPLEDHDEDEDEDEDVPGCGGRTRGEWVTFVVYAGITLPLFVIGFSNWDQCKLSKGDLAAWLISFAALNAAHVTWRFVFRTRLKPKNHWTSVMTYIIGLALFVDGIWGAVLTWTKQSLLNRNDGPHIGDGAEPCENTLFVTSLIAATIFVSVFGLIVVFGILFAGCKRGQRAAES